MIKLMFHDTQCLRYSKKQQHKKQGNNNKLQDNEHLKLMNIREQEKLSLTNNFFN